MSFCITGLERTENFETTLGYTVTALDISDESSRALQISKFECEYRATRREKMTKLLYESGCSEVVWKFPDETGFYQPIVVARK